jgi:hypothetical protein
LVTAEFFGQFVFPAGHFVLCEHFFHLHSGANILTYIL